MAFSSPTSRTDHFSNAKKYILAHKVLSIIGTFVVLFALYWIYNATHPTVVSTKYVLTTVQSGTIVSSISASGQISPSNQVTINPKASGQISQVLVRDSSTVRSGQVLAYISAIDQYNAVQNAKTSLASAQIALQKIQKPATALQLTQDQNAIAKAQASRDTDETNLTNSYGTSYSDIVATFLDLPSIQTQLQDVVIGTGASKGSQWNIDYYQNATQAWDNADALSYRTSTYAAYLNALSSYTSAYADFQKTSQLSSTSTIESLLNETYTTTQAEQNALNSANSFIQFYENQIKNHSQQPNSQADTSIATLSTDISKVNTHLSSLLSDKNQIASGKQAIINDNASITESQQSLAQLQAGADTLDLQSAQLSVDQQQNALQQAQDNLANYTIIAPFSGTLANLNLHVGDTVSSGTTIGTLITTQEIAELSLNEVDAAKVAVGQKATLTFDAIPNLTLTGTVADVSALGSVSQGVVSYTVKIGLDIQDPRVKAGMTVNANIQTAVHSNVLTVPSGAVKSSGGSSYVLAFIPAITTPGATSTSGIVSTRAPQSIPVTVGITDTTNTEIVSGLSEGDQIVRSTSGNATTKTSAASATSRSGFGGGPGGVRL